MKAANDKNRYLQLRRNVWFLHWNVPKELREHHFFGGKKIYTKTLQTSDVIEARRMRDQLVAEFDRLKAEAREAPRRHRFNSILEEVRMAKARIERDEPYMDDDTLLNSMDALESLYDAERAFDAGDRVKADAILVGLHGQTEIAKEYGITLQDAAESYIKENDDSLSYTLKHRVQTATASILKHANTQTLRLDQLDHREVTVWADLVGSHYSDRTRASLLSAMAGMWHWHYIRRNVEGDNPFRSIKMKRNKDAVAREDFSVDDVAKLAANAPDDFYHLMFFGLITGARIGEMAALNDDCFKVESGVHYIWIKDGKTSNATRKIPMPVTYWNQMRQCVEAGMWHHSGKTPAAARVSRAFSLFKVSTLGEGASASSFHSFRHMTATAYENAMIPEQVTVHIMGHSKKGTSESYRIYSSGMKLSILLEAVETMLASDYMQQFLKLFNK